MQTRIFIVILKLQAIRSAILISTFFYKAAVVLPEFRCSLYHYIVWQDLKFLSKPSAKKITVQESQLHFYSLFPAFPGKISSIPGNAVPSQFHVCSCLLQQSTTGNSGMQGGRQPPGPGRKRTSCLGSRGCLNSRSLLSHTATHRVGEAASTHVTAVCWRMALHRLSGDYCCGGWPF